MKELEKLIANESLPFRTVFSSFIHATMILETILEGREERELATKGAGTLLREILRYLLKDCRIVDDQLVDKIFVRIIKVALEELEEKVEYDGDEKQLSLSFLKNKHWIN